LQHGHQLLFVVALLRDLCRDEPSNALFFNN
jgi:hypothetical protein